MSLVCPNRHLTGSKVSDSSTQEEEKSWCEGKGGKFNTNPTGDTPVWRSTVFCNKGSETQEEGLVADPDLTALNMLVRGSSPRPSSDSNKMM